MNSFKLKYGVDTIQLTKSQTLLGIRPRQGSTREAEAACMQAQVELSAQHLGGFQVAQANDKEAMEDALDTLRAGPHIHLGTHVYHTSDDGVPFVPSGELYLVFADEAPLEECQRLLEEFALEIVETHGERELTVKITLRSLNPLKVAQALQQRAEISNAEPDLATPGHLAAFSLPSEPLLAQQWHLLNTGSLGGSSLGLQEGADARVVAAWKCAQTLGSPEVIVAVIDDGFDLEHPDLSNPEKIVAPWDFERNSANPRPMLHDSYPSWDATHQEWSGDWHGTACAGVAIGRANDSGILGAAPDCRFMPVRWGVSLTNSQVTSWFRYVTQQGAAVVSCSWGALAKYFPLSTPIRKAISQCATQGRDGKGCVVCFAAGNENRNVNDPANGLLNGFATHADVIAVAACTSRDRRSDYSNYGEAISICAPSSGAGGRGIMTADVTGSFRRNGRTIESGYSAGGLTDSFGGTSSATPLVAGICALLLSIMPDITSSQIKIVIQDTARKIGPAEAYDTSGHSQQFGYGCINAEAAVRKLLAS